MIEIKNEDFRTYIKSIPDNYVDCVVTDPPYGMSFQSNSRKDKYDKIKNDDNLNWLPFFISELKRVCKPSSHLYIFCSWHKIDVFKQEIEKHFLIKNIIVWAKNGGGMGDLKGGYAGSHEFCIFINQGNKPLNGKRETDVIKKAYRTGNQFHPTEKPVNLMAYLIEKSTEKKDMVADFFSGSGSTAIACAEIDRNFIGCEIDQRHYEVSQKRLKTALNQTRLF